MHDGKEGIFRNVIGFLCQVDLKPVCKKCYDRYPRDMRLRLKK